MSSKEVKKRKTNMRKDDHTLASNFAKDLIKLFQIKEKKSINTFFIDACYDEDDIQEKTAFEEGTEELWSFISRK